MKLDIIIDKRKLRPITTTKISVTLSEDNIQKMDESEIKNKSKFINWLLENYYNIDENNADI